MSGHSDDRPPVDLLDPSGQTDTERIAQSILPYSYDDARARYLSLRASGFTIREALRLIGYAHSTLSKWRMDEEFVALEARIPEFRSQLNSEYAQLEFMRNYRLVLEKDYRVLQKSIHPDKDEDGKDMPLAEQEQQYLIKMRSHYTPQQLQIIETLAKGDGDGGKEFDFTDLVIKASRMREEVEVRAKRGGSLVLPPGDNNDD